MKKEFIFIIVFITIIVTVIRSIFHHIHPNHLYSVPVSIYCFSNQCPRQDNKAVISLSSTLRFVIPVWLQSVVSVDDNLATKLENKNSRLY